MPQNRIHLVGLVELAQELGMSEASVWRRINAGQDGGACMRTPGRGGYVLLPEQLPAVVARLRGQAEAVCSHDELRPRVA